MVVRLVWLLLCLISFSLAQTETLRACTSAVYCDDEVLSVIQLSGIFNDSKTFVDMPMTSPVSVVLEAFRALPSPPSKKDIITFLADYFAPPGSDIEQWTPSDWTSNPLPLASIFDDELREWSYDLNNIWKELGRKTSTSVIEQPEQHSIFPVENGFIVPGGRFREFYYWDTYWIINGLLASSMFDTVNATLLNFASMIDTLGFIPNGARVYYSERTQPPLFTEMVWAYYQTAVNAPDYTANPEDILHDYVSYMDTEYQFWMSERSVSVSAGSDTFTLNRYQAHSNLPRPEGFQEDIETATEAGISDPLSPQQIYRDIASGAESGWDFSSRWFSNYENLTKIGTTEIIPVDLNAILYKNEITLYKIHTQLNDTQTAQQYLTAAQNRKNAFEKILWDDSVGLWIDYNITSGTLRSSDSKYFFASSFVPLWANLYWDGYTTGSYSPNHIETAFLQAISNVGMLDYVGGLPTSMRETGQQWDFPNGWAPLQLFAIRGLPNLGSSGDKMAAQLASSWLQNNYNGWTSVEQMFEKYNVTSTSGVPGDGGEYTVQSGFGWTNGVIFELLLQYCTTQTCLDENGNIQVPVLNSNGDSISGSRRME